ncbi:MAG: hypothetical protein ACXADC_08160 [Candidatus Thorarchaeota archaeon]|jgi:hypothetical protein
MKDPKKGTFGRYREVSELSIQFQCEYRFFLNQEYGENPSDASREGARLHREVGLNPLQVRSLNPFLTVILVIVIIAAALLWILG